jgi:hypothetical protein
MIANIVRPSSEGARSTMPVSATPAAIPRNLGSGDFGMRRFAAAEADLDLDFVPVFKETACSPDSHLQVVLVGAGPEAHLLDLRDMLVLFRVAGALVLLEPKLADVGDSADRRTRSCRDLDQVEPCLVGATKCLLDRHHADLLASSSTMRTSAARI